MTTNIASETQAPVVGLTARRLRALVAIPAVVLAVGIGGFLAAAPQTESYTAGICQAHNPNCMT